MKYTRYITFAFYYINHHQTFHSLWDGFQSQLHPHKAGGTPEKPELLRFYIRPRILLTLYLQPDGCATPPALCTCHERTFPRWQTPFPDVIESRARGTGGVQARRGGRRGAGKKPLSDPAPQPNVHQVKLSSRWLLRRKATYLRGKTHRHLLFALPFPPSHLRSVSSVSIYSKVTESP